MSLERPQRTRVRHPYGGIMRIGFIHKKHTDWYGAIVPCSRPGMYWAHTDDDSLCFKSLLEAQRYMKKKNYVPEEARHVAYL